MYVQADSATPRTSFKLTRSQLFYNKRSQYVSGVEEEKVNVCVGQKVRLSILRSPQVGAKLTSTQPINERIKELEFKDTKVRVTNVDSQGSDANIVIQVIGEISNQGQPHKRFVQTFVLAEQTNGYFVLNDIFRYLAEEPEEEEDVHEPAANGIEEPAPTAAPVEQEAPQGEVASSEEDLTKVDEKLEEVAQEESAAKETPAAAPAEEAAEAEKAPEVEEVAAAAPEEAPKDTKAAAEPVVEEKPKDPTPTPAPAAKAAAPVAMPAGPPKPAAPRTWASLAASAASAQKVATPVVAAPAAQQAPKENKASTPAQPAAAAAQAAAAAPEQSPTASQGETAGWQSVTGHKKEQSRAQNQASAAEADQKRAYIKNVYSQVQEGSLRAALSKFGDIEYLDLSRGKVSKSVADLQTRANIPTERCFR